jgi:hypothetical protein
MMTGTAEEKMLEPEPTDLNVVNDLDLPEEDDGISVRRLFTVALSVCLKYCAACI